MHVKILEGQADISKPNLADLQVMLDRAIVEFQDADLAESSARSRATAAKNAVSEAQRKLNAAIALLKQDAPNGTPWADERR